MGDDDRHTALRTASAAANRALVEAGLVTLSFGNASAVDRERGILLIKPSGYPCGTLAPDDLVAVSLATGQVVDDANGGAGAGAAAAGASGASARPGDTAGATDAGRARGAGARPSGAAGVDPGAALAGDAVRRRRPSSDTPTHLALYRAYPTLGGIVHTHSPYASAWAQAGRDLPCLGTTHADHFAGSVPVTRALTAEEIAGDYEAETGHVIVETLAGRGLDPLDMPAVLVASHGPFAWGATPAEAVTNAVALEAVAAMALRTLALSPATESIAQALSDRHHTRKHGPTAYYGQPD
jgi:L-ribulose-5-phosphate 4-epimerase